MDTLSIFIVVVAIAALAFGVFVGLGVAASNGDAPSNSRFAQLVTARRNAVLNLAFALVAWALVFVAVPGVTARALGAGDGAVYAMGFGAQLLAGFVGLLIGQRGWRQGPKRNNNAV